MTRKASALYLLDALIGALIMTVLFSVQPDTGVKSATATEIPIYMISTRDVLNYRGVEGKGYGNYSFSNILKLYEACPPEVAVFVHGWGNNQTLATERLDRVKMSLENNSYAYPLIGLSWDSKIPWSSAKFTANENGPKLAQFIIDLKEKCSQTTVRMNVHSLGARVVLSSLDNLHKNQLWNNNNHSIASVHLMGAAVDNEEVSKNPKDVLIDQMNWGSSKLDYGIAIEDEVSNFYNLYNSEDNVLEPTPNNPFSPFQVYPSFEGDLALGQNGSQTFPYPTVLSIALPQNFEDVNVTNEIKGLLDADGIEAEVFGLCESNNHYCEIEDEGWDFGLCNLVALSCQNNTGDNHAGYLRFRDTNNSSQLADDGAVDIAVSHWRNETERSS